MKKSMHEDLKMDCLQLIKSKGKHQRVNNMSVYAMEPGQNRGAALHLHLHTTPSLEEEATEEE